MDKSAAELPGLSTGQDRRVFHRNVQGGGGGQITLPWYFENCGITRIL